MGQAAGAIGVLARGRELLLAQLALGGGERVDWALQPTNVEAAEGEYLVSLGSHSGYWASEDTILFLLNRLCAVRGETLLQAA